MGTGLHEGSRNQGSHLSSAATDHTTLQDPPLSFVDHGLICRLGWESWPLGPQKVPPEVGMGLTARELYR